MSVVDISGKVQQVVDHAVSRMNSGEFSLSDISLIEKVAYPDAIDELISPQAKNSEWQVAYREALPIVKQKWESFND